MKYGLAGLLALLLLVPSAPVLAADGLYVCKCREGNELWLWDADTVTQLCKRHCPVQQEHSYAVDPVTREVFCETPGLPHRVRYRSQTDLDLVTSEGALIYRPTGLTPRTVNRLFMGTYTALQELTFGSVENAVPFQCHVDINLSETYAAFRSGPDLTHHLLLGITGSEVVPLRPVLYSGADHRVEAYSEGPRIRFGENGEMALQYCFDGTRWTSSKIVRLLNAEETEVYSPNDYTCGEDALVYYSGVLVKYAPRR